MSEKTERANMNEQSRETCNTEYIKHKTKTNKQTKTQHNTICVGHRYAWFGLSFCWLLNLKEAHLRTIPDKS